MVRGLPSFLFLLMADGLRTVILTGSGGVGETDPESAGGDSGRGSAPIVAIYQYR